MASKSRRIGRKKRRAAARRRKKDVALQFRKRLDEEAEASMGIGRYVDDPRYQVGREVTILMAADPAETPQQNSEMMQLVGKRAKIRHSFHDNTPDEAVRWVRLDIDGERWHWHPDWLEPFPLMDISKKLKECRWW